jgi:DNA-binding transcriptional regulator/RsmH inhibitor MraZ
MTHFPFIEIIPQSAIRDFIEQDDTNPPGSREYLWGMRKVSRPFREFTIDSSNRISLNAAFRFHLGLLPGDEVLVVGMDNHLELWNSRHYDLAGADYLMSA